MKMKGSTPKAQDPSNRNQRTQNNKKNNERKLPRTEWHKSSVKDIVEFPDNLSEETHATGLSL